MEIKLGMTVKDLVTGYEGIAVTIAKYLHGCRRIGVQAPLDALGRIPDEITVDEPQLVIVKKKRIIDVKISKTKVILGASVSCPISGFEGVAWGRCDYLNGCARVAVCPKVGGDNKINMEWFPEDQLIIKDDPKFKQGSSTTGGPVPRINNSFNRSVR